MEREERVWKDARRWWRTNDLDLDIHLDQLLRQWVDLHETRVHCAIEAAEFGDQPDVTLADWLVGVGAKDAEGDGAAETDAGTEGVDCEELQQLVQASEGVGHRLGRSSGEWALETYSLSRTSHGCQRPHRRGVLERKRAGDLRGEEARR